MVQVTVELVRKKAEHHEKQLAPLREISLHQESIEKIENIQNWCPKLQILLLQSNLISKIENLNKLKELEYLNLAINNIERIENLERCESLVKLDLTLNFIGELTSIQNLKNNIHLRTLFLTGNPCTDFKGYKEYVIAILPQLEELDGMEIKRTDRIIAMRNLSLLKNNIELQQEKYRIKRLKQKERLEEEIREKLTCEHFNIDDEEKSKRFWNEKSEHSPEIRIEMDRQVRLRRENNIQKNNKSPKKERALFTSDGRPYNINEAKLDFIFKDDNPVSLELELFIYKYLDTELVNIDLQPTYVRVKIKSKLFQFALPEEISVSESVAKRSQTTGHLVITMKKYLAKDIKEYEKPKDETKLYKEVNNQKRELLEIGSSRKIIDFTSATLEKIIPKNEVDINIEDNPEIPPLI